MNAWQENEFLHKRKAHQLWCFICKKRPVGITHIYDNSFYQFLNKKNIFFIKRQISLKSVDCFWQKFLWLIQIRNCLAHTTLIAKMIFVKNVRVKVFYGKNNYRKVASTNACYKLRNQDFRCAWKRDVLQNGTR